MDVKAAAPSFPEVRAKLWLGDLEDPTCEVLEGETVFAVAERTAGDEVAVHVARQGDDNALITVYMPRVQAIALARAIDGEATRAYD